MEWSDISWSITTELPNYRLIIIRLLIILIITFLQPLFKRFLFICLNTKVFTNNKNGNINGEVYSRWKLCFEKNKRNKFSFTIRTKSHESGILMIKLLYNFLFCTAFCAKYFCRFLKFSIVFWYSLKITQEVHNVQEVLSNFYNLLHIDIQYTLQFLDLNYNVLYM